MGKNIIKSKICLIVILSLFVLFIGLSALSKALDATSIKKIMFEIIGLYISLFTLHFLNSFLKDYIREYKNIK